MVWESRKGRLYFYKSVRLSDGRRVTEYYGRGPRAFVAALVVDRRVLERSEQLKVIAELRAETIEAEELAQIFHDGVSDFFAAEMRANGFHNPKSRGWRKIMRTDVENDKAECAEKTAAVQGVHPSDRSAQCGNDSASGTEIVQKAILNRAAVSRIRAPRKVREPKVAEVDDRGAAETASAADEAVESAIDPGASVSAEKLVEEMNEQELRKAARAGNRAAISRLRPFMDRNSSHHAALGCLNAKAKIKWGEAFYNQNLFERDCLRRSQENLAASLLADGDSPLERLMVDDIVLCFLRSRYWMIRETESVSSDINLMVADFTVEQSAKAQKQLLKAMDALRDYRNLIVRRSLPTPPKVLEEPVADNAAGST
jgi:hypothetical protein